MSFWQGIVVFPDPRTYSKPEQVSSDQSDQLSGRNSENRLQTLHCCNNRWAAHLPHALRYSTHVANTQYVCDGDLQCSTRIGITQYDWRSLGQEKVIRYSWTTRQSARTHSGSSGQCRLRTMNLTDGSPEGQYSGRWQSHLGEDSAYSDEQ